MIIESNYLSLAEECIKYENRLPYEYSTKIYDPTKIKTPNRVCSRGDNITDKYGG